MGIPPHRGGLQRRPGGSGRARSGALAWLNLCSEAERERVGNLLGWGLVDLLRVHQAGPGPFTWWDYRAGAFHRGWGLRIVSR